MIATMASGWRCDAKLDAKGEMAWNAQVADENVAARPGSCCLHVMGDMQTFIDILRALGFDTLQGLWGFIKFYDSIDPQMLFVELSAHGYGHTKTALTLLVHFAPMLLNLGKAFEGPTDSRGCGIVAGCGRSGSMARGLTARSLAKLWTFVERVVGCNNSVIGDDATAPRPGEGKGVKTLIYVDDATMVMWAKKSLQDRPALPHMAYDVAREWTDLVVNICGFKPP